MNTIQNISNQIFQYIKSAAGKISKITARVNSLFNAYQNSVEKFNLKKRATVLHPEALIRNHSNTIEKQKKASFTKKIHVVDLSEEKKGVTEKKETHVTTLSEKEKQEKITAFRRELIDAGVRKTFLRDILSDVFEKSDFSESVKELILNGLRD